MTETLAKEVLEEEKNATNSIFETELFEDVYQNLTKEQGDIGEDIKGILHKGMKDFVKKQIESKAICNGLYDDSLEIAFWAGIAISMGGQIFSKQRDELEKSSNNIKKRVIRKENLIGFNITFENEKDIVAKTILPKEQYEELIATGKTDKEIVSRSIKGNKIIKDVQPMTDEELSQWLDVAADKILKGELDD